MTLSTVIMLARSILTEHVVMGKGALTANGLMAAISNTIELQVSSRCFAEKMALLL